MNLKARFNLLFYKNQCIKVIITDLNKRVKTHIVKIDDNKDFNIGERTFMINYDAVFMSGSLPTYFYYISNPTSISIKELKKHNQPLDPEEASRRLDVSSDDLYTAIEETISSKIIRYAEDGDKRIINTVYMMGAMNLLATLGIGYFLYTTIEKVLTFFAENQMLIEAIKNALVNGVGN